MRVKNLFRRGKLAAIIFWALLTIPIFGIDIATATSPTEWTQNSTFVLGGYRWDPILYQYQWLGSNTYEVFSYDYSNYALWTQNGVVRLAASDQFVDNYGRSARITYGLFLSPYPDELPPLRSMPNTDTLTLKARVSNYGSVNDNAFSYTGIKFDAWFTNPLNNGRRMVIEMYFHGTGIPQNWGNEMHRTIGDGQIDDLLIKLQAFPEYCTMTGDIPWSFFGGTGAWAWSYTEFTIDLKAIWQKAASYFGRLSADDLYAVALDIESCVTNYKLGDRPIQSFAEANEIKVTYTAPPNTPSAPSGPSSGYRWKEYSYTTSTTDANGDDIQYQFDWGDGSTDWTGYYSSGATASSSHSWEYIGGYPIRVRAKDATGLYSGWSPYKKMNIYNQPGNPCPALFAWDGSQYVEIGVLDIHADSDITFVQGIEQTLVAENHMYKFSLRELDDFTSHIDYVKLYAVNNDVEKYECHLAQAIHNETGHIERLLLHDDDKRVDLNPRQTIDLSFTVPTMNEIAYLIFEINGYNIKA